MWCWYRIDSYSRFDQTRLQIGNPSGESRVNAINAYFEISILGFSVAYEIIDVDIDLVYPNAFVICDRRNRECYSAAQSADHQLDRTAQILARCITAGDCKGSVAELHLCFSIFILHIRGIILH